MRSLLFVGVLVGVLATPPLWAYEVVPVADGGVLVGKVIFTGTPPEPKQILISDELLRDRLAYGTPAMVAERLAQLREASGLSGVIIEPNVGGRIPPELVFQSVHLFGEEVIPRLR